MLRLGPATSLVRSSLRSTTFTRKVSQVSTHQCPKVILPRATRPQGPRSLALTAYRPFTTSLQRYAATDARSPETPYDHIDEKREKQLRKKQLTPHPEEVSEDSSVHQIFHEKGVPDAEKDDEDMLAGVYSDV
ncbi:MAG: hypothetical protein Q9183_007700, partial [Haloplaca sp. 2 TL-2023]